MSRRGNSIWIYDGRSDELTIQNSHEKRVISREFLHKVVPLSKTDCLLIDGEYRLKILDSVTNRATYIFSETKVDDVFFIEEHQLIVIKAGEKLQLLRVSGERIARSKLLGITPTCFDYCPERNSVVVGDLGGDVYEYKLPPTG